MIIREIRKQNLNVMIPNNTLRNHHYNAHRVRFLFCVHETIMHTKERFLENLNYNVLN